MIWLQIIGTKDAVEAIELDEFEGDTENLSNSNEQVLGNSVSGNDESDQELSNTDFSHSGDDNCSSKASFSSLSDEEIFVENVAQGEIEIECAENNNHRDNTFKSESPSDKEFRLAFVSKFPYNNCRNSSHDYDICNEAHVNLVCCGRYAEIV